jgi:hypothetical protein
MKIVCDIGKGEFGPDFLSEPVGINALKRDIFIRWKSKKCKEKGCRGNR